MPAYRNLHSLHFCQRFLYPVFPDVAHAGQVRCLYRFRTVRFGDRDDGDVLAMPSPLRRSVDSAANGRDASTQLRKKHSTQI